MRAEAKNAVFRGLELVIEELIGELIKADSNKAEFRGLDIIGELMIDVDLCKLMY